MASSQAVDTFWVQLIESGLVPERQVKTLARKLSREEVASDSAAARKLVQLGVITRYQASRLLEGRSRGFFFDQYKLLDLLGVGGMGWVYRAEHTETGEIVALKVLLDQFKNDHGMLARFEQECRAGLKFQHDNIVKTHFNGSAGGLPYVIMEFVEGPSLLELLRIREGTRLHWEQACDIARQAALGLHCIHQGGFVHRDIKPQNLLIDHSGHVKLIDFGLSMKNEGESGDEFSMAMIFGHECVGTAAYTAPEQAVDSLRADARSDVYSLGCTLFATMTGDTPFPYKNPQDVLKAHQIEIARNVCEVIPSIPRPVGEIVAKMLAKKPEDRYATAQDAANELTVWCRRSQVEFDFSKILAERNKCATEKLIEMQKRQRSSTGAASSTANPARISSVANGAINQSPISSLQTSASSITRRDPFGYESQPLISLRQSVAKNPQADTNSDEARKSGMFLTPVTSGAPIRLMKSHFVIGRSPECDLQVQDNAVSSQHCELRFDGYEWSIKDLKSRNGIRVNGEIVKKQILQRGDTIVVGPSLRLRFGDGRPPKPKSVFSRIRKPVLAMVLTALTVGLIAVGFWYLRH